MHKLSIFDDKDLVGTITLSGNSVFIFARSSREWKEMKRLSTFVNVKDKKYLEKLAVKAHEFNYNTEITK